MVLRFRGMKEILARFQVSALKKYSMNKTNLIVREAMRQVSKDVRLPRCVRNGTVKFRNNEGKSDKRV